MGEAIRVEGVHELNRKLRRLRKDLPNAVKAAGVTAANQIVNEGKPKVPFGPSTGGHARSSIKVVSAGTQTRVEAGGQRFPYYPWLEFGGAVGRRRSVRRPFVTTGRYVWKAYNDRKTQLPAELEQQLSDTARSAGLKVD